MMTICRPSGIVCKLVKKLTKLYLVFVTYMFLGLLVLPKHQALEQLFYAHSKLACEQPHYYDSDSTYIVRANGDITGHKCEMVFKQSEWSDAVIGQPCYSLCVKIINYTMNSCDFQMAYFDGLGDTKPKKFDCHTFPSYLWCTSKNDLKIRFAELRKYKGEGYDITLEVKTYCKVRERTETPIPKEETYNDKFLKEEKRQRDTVIITGSLVSAVSFLFVIFWITYCCWKRRSPSRRDSTPRSTANTTPKSQSSSGYSAAQIVRKPMHQNSPNHMPYRDDNIHQWYPMHGIPNPMPYPPSYIPPHLTACHHTKHNDTGYESQIEARYTKMPGNLDEDDNDDEVVSYFPNCQSHARCSPVKDVRFQEDQEQQKFMDNNRRFILHRQQSPGRDTDYHQSEARQQLIHHPYDADAEMPYNTEAPPPLPPRPLIPLQPFQPAKQYFI